MARTPEAQEWIDDLTDPDNQGRQGRGRLQSGRDKFCCLGRLCLIAERHGVHVERTPAGRIRGCLLEEQPQVKAWAHTHGIPVHAGYVRGGVDSMSVNVAALNDFNRITFYRIGRQLADGPLA